MSEQYMDCPSCGADAFKHTTCGGCDKLVLTRAEVRRLVQIRDDIGGVHTYPSETKSLLQLGFIERVVNGWALTRKGDRWFA